MEAKKFKLTPDPLSCKEKIGGRLKKVATNEVSGSLVKECDNKKDLNL